MKRFMFVAICFYAASAMSLLTGFDKMYVYHNSDYAFDNAYVGGDAYNYIINAGYATAYFVLAMGFLITGTIFLYMYMKLNHTNDNNHMQGRIENDIESNVKNSCDQMPEL